MAVFEGTVVDKAQLDLLRFELEDARGEISSLIGQIEGVREDLGNGERRGLRFICCYCSRRDLRKLEDRLWLRLHQLQEKENELHRQRTAILSRPISGMSDTSVDPRSPALWHQPLPVSPEAPESPPWRQQPPPQQQRTPLLPERRQLAPSSNPVVENHVPVPLRIVSEAGAPAPVVQRRAQPPRPRHQPIPATRPLSLRRRPCRPGSAEDTGSGAE